jgi:hypothetical protein
VFGAGESPSGTIKIQRIISHTNVPHRARQHTNLKPTCDTVLREAAKEFISCALVWYKLASVRRPAYDSVCTELSIRTVTIFHYTVRFHVLTAVSMKMCILVETDRRFRDAYCLHHQGGDLMMEAVRTSETSENLFPDYTAKHPRRHSFSFPTIYTILSISRHKWYCRYSCISFPTIIAPIVAVTKLNTSRSQQNRTTLQHKQRRPGEWRQLRTRNVTKLATLYCLLRAAVQGKKSFRGLEATWWRRLWLHGAEFSSRS